MVNKLRQTVSTVLCNDQFNLNILSQIDRKQNKHTKRKEIIYTQTVVGITNGSLSRMWVKK